MYSTWKSISVSVAVAMRACVRACEAARVREGSDSFGARPAKSTFVMCRRPPASRPAAGRRRGSMEIEKKMSCFFDLIG